MTECRLHIPVGYIDKFSFFLRKVLRINLSKTYRTHRKVSYNKFIFFLSCICICSFWVLFWSHCLKHYFEAYGASFNYRKIFISTGGNILSLNYSEDLSENDLSKSSFKSSCTRGVEPLTIFIAHSTAIPFCPMCNIKVYLCQPFWGDHISIPVVWSRENQSNSPSSGLTFRECNHSPRLIKLCFFDLNSQLFFSSGADS